MPKRVRSRRPAVAMLIREAALAATQAVPLALTIDDIADALYLIAGHAPPPVMGLSIGAWPAER